MAATTTATNIQKEENPRKTLDQQHQSTDPPPTRTTDHTPDTNLSSTLQQQTFVDGTNAPIKDGDESKSAGDSPATGDPPVGSTAASSNADAPVSSIQKKIRRAERFGMPVQLSEEEKRNSRAERFGTAPAAHGSDALKKSEEQKRKARAERFGLVQSVNADEEVKKKARLARFAGVSKTDSQEEDKKKARAIRFSQSSSGSLSEVNGKGNIEPKTAITGKAGGGVV